eukprot:TRINITY_DN8820_c0_g1_i1.p1 TRINITY_DN8820_c0_g1~~TRINITY_DN8820_c0_g1_i1.p1  ORF type:complete len:149 (-),score=37.14 TRINITY_DN8820_c0_g1_i1:185-631(-)
MSKIVRPMHFKWQRQPYQKSFGPIFRHVNRVRVAYYPFSPRTRTCLHFQGLIQSRKQPKEKGFESEVEHLPFGKHAVIDLEYRTGEKLTIDAEKYNANQVLEIMKRKRLDMELHMDWVDFSVFTTLEEEAADGGADVDMKKERKDKKK